MEAIEPPFLLNGNSPIVNMVFPKLSWKTPKNAIYTCFLHNKPISLQ